MLKKIVAMSLVATQILCANSVFANLVPKMEEPAEIIVEKNGGIISQVNRISDDAVLQAEMEKVKLLLVWVVL